MSNNTTSVESALKFTVITAVRNDHRVVDAIHSVRSQVGVNVEHVIVDGMSDDGTSEIIDKNVDIHTIVIREPDHGLYDAINKGIYKATGDLVGFLNADDRFAETTALQKVRQCFCQSKAQIVFGNLRYVNKTGQTVRRWRSRPFQQGLFQKSWTPAHPTFYTYRANYQQFGLYRTDFRIAADVELMYRFLEVHKLSSGYLPEEIVVMSAGGISNRGTGSTLTIYREVKQGILENGGTFNDVKYLFHKLLKARELLARK